MKHVFIAAFAFLTIWIIYVSLEDKPNDKLITLKEEIEEKKAAPQVVDHSKFEELQQDFESPRDVTAACISCHNERHKEVMQSAHWKWEREEFIEGRGVVKIGKKNVINNFCIGIESSEGTCTTCHAGYGWQDSTFDFNDPLNVDCLVCHDNTGDYHKGSEMAGLPDPKVDLGSVARSAGTPKNKNCGSCHFLGGGGNNVKHGDLEVALLSTTRDVDVHMGQDGANLDCVDCHETENHKIPGKLYSVSSMNVDRVECESCHTARPHADDVINEHTVKVGCQTCHIPTYAKVNPTKMFWDWSKACKIMDPSYTEVDSAGVRVYLAKKGRFVWQKDVKPEYIWFDGTADHYMLGDKIDTNDLPIEINTLNGSYADRDSKIIPTKIHRTRQPYDPIYMTLIQPKLWDAEYGNGALWVDCVTIPIEKMWDISSAKGMEYVGLPYSGEYAFTNTKMYWPVNHMVSPAENALECKDCHTTNGGRLAGLTGFYVPGRDRNSAIEFLGTFAIIASILGVAIHSGLRIVSSRKNGSEE